MCSFYGHHAPTGKKVRYLKRKRHVADIRLIWIRADDKSQFPAHVDHRHIFVQDLSFNAAVLLCPRIGDDHLHQMPSQTVALQIGANEDGVFAAVRVCGRMEAGDAQHLPRRLIERDEGHGPYVIDASESGDKFMAELLYRRKEAPAQIVRRLHRKEPAVKDFVLGANGSNEDGPVVL